MRVPIAVYPAPAVGCHINIVPAERLKKLYTIFQLETVAYLLSIGFAKISILLLCFRVFRSNVGFRKTCYILFVVIAGYCVGSLLAVIFRCRPISAGWSSPAQGTNRCLSLLKLQVVIGWFNIVTDVALMILPMPILWGLNMPWQKKAGVVVVFGTGAAVLAMSIARQAVLYGSLSGLDTDITWSAVLTHILFTLELNIAIICGCLPTMQPLFRRFSIPLPSAVLSAFSAYGRMARSASRTSSGSKTQASSRAPPPTWGSMPLRSPRPRFTPAGEPTWTTEWEWGLMSDADDCADDKQESPRERLTYIGPQKRSGFQGESETGTPLATQDSPLNNPENLGRSEYTSRGSERDITRECQDAAFAQQMVTGIQRPPTLSIASSGLAARRRASTLSVPGGRSPLTIHFAEDPSPSQRPASATPSTRKFAGRRSLDLGTAGTNQASFIDSQRRKSENDAVQANPDSRLMAILKEERDEG